MKNIIQAIKDCHSARINCCACGAGERVYFIPESIISKLEVVVAKMETTTSTCKDSLQVGDIAAMREALESARDLILPHCNGSTEFAKGCGETVNKIMNALAKPPRNCDLFGGDPKMLYTAWFDWTASPSGMNDDGTVKLTYGEWLLVRAKGGAYANR
jgi:hypothetical protein